MKSIVAASLIALALTTGFTCAKNQPTTETAPAPTQEQMAAPAETGAPADGMTGPVETEPVAPTEETK